MRVKNYSQACAGVMAAFLLAVPAWSQKNSQKMPPCQFPKIDASSNRLNVDQSGRYCLNKDLKVKAELEWLVAEGSPGGGSVVSIHVPDVEIDLMGHEIYGYSTNTAAVGVDRGDTHIKNGIIKSRTDRGLIFDGALGSTYVSLISEIRSSMSTADPDVFLYRIKHEIEPLQKLKGHFPLANHRLEQLTIESALRGIGIKGGGNVIRNSTITVQQEGPGIYLIGPQQLIENNVIVVPAPKGGARPNHSPIKLHLADNSIIRHNTLIIERWGDKPEAAISIIDSKNVLIEHNTVIGTQTLYKIWDEDPGQESSVTERGNAFASPLSRFFGR